MSDSIKAMVFDVYGTLFDVQSVAQDCERFYPGKGEKISQTWHAKQIEYFFLRQLMEKYVTFLQITNEALRYAIKENGEELNGQTEKQLLEAYLHLSPYSEVEEVLGQLTNKKRVIFSNGSHDMLDGLVQNSGFPELFDQVISIDEIKHYKPTLASYHYLLDVLNLKHHEILFMSSNRWDISGAKNFGFQTAWINRKDQLVDELGLAPDYIFSDLKGLLKWN